MSIPELAVEEFATTSGWHAALNIQTAASVSGVILRIISSFGHHSGNNDKNGIHFRPKMKFKDHQSACISKGVIRCINDRALIQSLAAKI